MRIFRATQCSSYRCGAMPPATLNFRHGEPHRHLGSKAAVPQQDQGVLEFSMTSSMDEKKPFISQGLPQ